MKTHTFALDFVLPYGYYAQTFYVPSHLIISPPVIVIPISQWINQAEGGR